MATKTPPKWIWKRHSGDIEIHAWSAREALIRIRESGIMCPGVNVIELAPDEPDDVHKREIK